ncbi:MAG: enoyl-CoA hydratase-related protein, partial [Planctomycetota bacterium]
MSEYNLSSIKVQVDSNSVATAILDMPESSANVLTEGLFAELDHLFSDLEKRDDLRGLVLLSAKRNIFVAGADLKRIHRTLDWPDEKIIQFCEDGRMVMSRLSRMPFATVAAIHGACVGGGLELTLWCDYRVVADDKRTVLGLPEVKLGLVPGWAGTVRLPRLAGLENGIDLIASGRLVTAKQSLEMGFVDQIAELESLESAAKDLTLSASLEDLKNLRRAILGPVQPVSDIDALHRRSIERVEQNSETFSFAPKIVVNHLVESSSLDHDAACHRESLAMAAVYGSEPNYGLLNNFFLGEHNKKNPGFVDLKLAVREFKKVGIVGAGTMGLGVARACAQSRFDVVVLDAAEDVVRRAKVALLDEGLNEKADLKFTQQYA